MPRMPLPARPSEHANMPRVHQDVRSGHQTAGAIPPMLPLPTRVHMRTVRRPKDDRERREMPQLQHPSRGNRCTRHNDPARHDRGPEEGETRTRRGRRGRLLLAVPGLPALQHRDGIRSRMHMQHRTLVPTNGPPSTPKSEPHPVPEMRPLPSPR